jgi:hypothetical protein
MSNIIIEVILLQLNNSYPKSLAICMRKFNKIVINYKINDRKISMIISVLKE